MSKISEWLPRVLVESFLIVVSILLALGLDQWQEDREIQELVDRSIQSFEIEIQRNKLSIEDVTPFHQGLREVLTRRNEDGAVDSLAEFRDIMEGFRAAVLLRSAWETAVATGILSRMDYEMVAALSLVYSTQSRFEEIYARGNNAILTSGRLTAEGLHTSVYYAIRFMTEVNTAEVQLNSMYEAALNVIADHKNKPSDDAPEGASESPST